MDALPYPPLELNMIDYKQILNKTLGELCESDPWVKNFMKETYNIFGMPRSIDDCLNQSDKILYVWSMMMLVREMKTDETWKGLREDNNPEDAAYTFSKNYFDKTGKFLLASPSDEEKFIGPHLKEKKK